MRIITIPILSVLSGLMAAEAGYPTASNAEELTKVVAEYTEPHNKTLVAMDIDLTITQPDHPALYLRNVGAHKDKYKEIIAEFTATQVDDLIAKAAISAPQILVDESMAEFIRKMQREAEKVVGVTAISTRVKPAGYSDLAAWRRQVLYELDVDFQEPFNRGRTNLEIIPAAKDHPPFYEYGIVYANSENKGRALMSFLKITPYMPDTIVLIDDMKANIESTEAYFKEAHPDIKFVGILFSGALKFKKDISAEDFTAYWSKLKSAVK